MPAERMRNCVTDWITIAKNGHRLTDNQKKRTQRIRRYPWLVPTTDVSGGSSRLRVARWWGNDRIDIATYYFSTDTVLINADNHWPRQVAHRLRMNMAEILESLDQPYVMLSFAAMHLAGIQASTVQRITGELLSDQMVTKKEDTPTWLTQRRRWQSKFTPGDKPKKRTDGVAPYAWIAEQDGVAGWRWSDSWIEEIPPDKDGFYRWSRRLRWNQPACVFSSQINRVNGRTGYAEIRRGVRFISALDHNDRVPRYFLSEIPAKAKAHTVEAALDSLAPSVVHLARKQGRRVVRQGDIFAIKTDVTEKELKTRLATRIRMREFYKNQYFTGSGWNSGLMLSRWHAERFPENSANALVTGHYHDVAGRLRVHGTGHSCTEIIKTTDGMVYGKGQMRHEPRLVGEQRDRDHQNMPLDDGRDGWWLLVRNAVPALN